MSRRDAEPVRVRLAASVDARAGATTPRAARQSAISPPASPAPPLLPGAPTPPGTPSAPPGTPSAPAATADGHYGRLRDGARRLRATARTFKVTDRTLLVAGGILAPVGILVIVIGWWGAAHSPFLFQQVPYLISGGLLGLALVILGSFLYFGYWLTQVVKEQRRQATAVVDAIERLERVAAGLSGGQAPARNGHSSAPGAAAAAGVAVAPSLAPEAGPTDASTQAAADVDGRAARRAGTREAGTGAAGQPGTGESGTGAAGQSRTGAAGQSRTGAADESGTATGQSRADESGTAAGQSRADAAGQTGTGAAPHGVAQTVVPPPADPGASQAPEVFGDPVLDTLVTTPDEVFLATAKGTMAHQRDCVVVAGKTGLRQVTKADGLAPCKLCAPYDA